MGKPGECKFLSSPRMGQNIAGCSGPLTSWAVSVVSKGTAKVCTGYLSVSLMGSQAPPTKLADQPKLLGVIRLTGASVFSPAKVGAAVFTCVNWFYPKFRFTRHEG